MEDTFDNVITRLNSLLHGDKIHIQTQPEFIVRVLHPPSQDRNLGVYYISWCEGRYRDYSDDIDSVRWKCPQR